MTVNTVIVELPNAGAVFTKLGYHGFYWCDAFNIEDYGPFDSVYEAMKHYTSVLQNRKTNTAPLPPPPPPLNVINVDFKNRYRVG